MRRKRPIEIPRLDARAIGGRIASARRLYQWSQARLAELVGMKENTVSNWETRVRVPPRDMLVKLSITLRRTIDFLLLGKRSRTGSARTVGGVSHEAGGSRPYED